MKYITLEMLKQANACADKQELFKDTFGTKAKLMESNVTKAIKAGLYFGWLASMLPQTMLEAYEYQANLIWEVYVAQRDAMWEAHDLQQDPLWKDYADRTTLLFETYASQLNTLLLNALIAA